MLQAPLVRWSFCKWVRVRAERVVPCLGVTALLLLSAWILRMEWSSSASTGGRFVRTVSGAPGGTTWAARGPWGATPRGGGQVGQGLRIGSACGARSSCAPSERVRARRGPRTRCPGVSWQWDRAHARWGRAARARWQGRLTVNVSSSAKIVLVDAFWYTE